MLHADDAEVIDAVERLRLGGLLVQVTSRSTVKSCPPSRSTR